MSSSGDEDEWGAELHKEEELLKQKQEEELVATQKKKAQDAQARVKNATDVSLNQKSINEILAMLQDTRLDDPTKERERKELLVEAAEMKSASNLMDGEFPEEEIRMRSLLLMAQSKPSLFESPKRDTDGFSHFNFDFDKLKDIEAFLDSIRPKIEQSKAKSPIWLRLMDDLFAMCAPKMDIKDLSTIQRKVQNAVTAKQREVNLTAQKSRKADNLKPSSKHYQDEYAMMYGERDSSSGSEYVDDEEDEISGNVEQMKDAAVDKKEEDVQTQSRDVTSPLKTDDTTQKPAVAMDFPGLPGGGGDNKPKLYQPPTRAGGPPPSAGLPTRPLWGKR